MELSDYSSESQKIIKWKAGKVKDITPGEFDIELNEEKPEAYYRLTVDESGVYYAVSYTHLLQKQVRKLLTKEQSIRRQKRRQQYMISFRVSRENICFLQKMGEQEKYIVQIGKK